MHAKRVCGRLKWQVILRELHTQCFHLQPVAVLAFDKINKQAQQLIYQNCDGRNQKELRVGGPPSLLTLFYLSQVPIERISRAHTDDLELGIHRVNGSLQ